MKSFRAWLADVFLGPPCRRCGYRARGPRSLYAHYLTDHPEVHNP